MISLIFIVNEPICNDEIPYLTNVSLIHKYGLGNEYLAQLQGSAGPLYSFVHYLFEPITRLQAPGIRLVNVFFLIGTIFFLALILRSTGYTHWSYSLYILAIPKVYVLTGLAFTEMPAIFFYTLFLFCVLKAADLNIPSINRFGFAFIGGTCLCLSILGRQPFLLTIAAVPILFFKEWSLRSILIQSIIFIAALALPCYVFLQWKGWMPPGDSIYYPDKPLEFYLRPDFFILCLFYVAVVFVVLAPSIFRIDNRRELFLAGVGIILAGVLNFFFKWINYLPAMHLLGGMPSHLIQVAELFFGWIFICISVYFLYKLLKTAVVYKGNTQLIFFIASTLLICAASLKITWGFSSRYSALAAPLMVLIASFYYRRNRINYLLIVAAIIMGLISLYFYYG